MIYSHAQKLRPPASLIKQERKIVANVVLLCLLSICSCSSTNSGNVLKSFRPLALFLLMTELTQFHISLSSSLLLLSAQQEVVNAFLKVFVWL